MAQLYIDTNVFLDFYQAATDRIAVFAEIVGRANRIVMPEQSIVEFYRNRANRLSELARKIADAPPPSLFTTSVVRELPEFAKWLESRDVCQKQAKAIATALRAWIDNAGSDLVLAEFSKLVDGCQKIHTTDALIAKAQRRKSLGNPPTSPDRHTIGDELIWESLLESCAEDLIVVSRDKTFLDNVSILAGEFRRPKRNLVGVTRHLGEALAQLEIPSKVIEQTERDLESVRATAAEDSPCPQCGGHLTTLGFEGSSGDEAYWWECDKCGEMYFPVR